MTTTEEIVGLLRWFKVNGLLPELRDDMASLSYCLGVAAGLAMHAGMISKVSAADLGNWLSAQTNAADVVQLIEQL